MTCVVTLSVVLQPLLLYPGHSMPGVTMVFLQPQSQSTLKMEWYRIVSQSVTQRTFPMCWEITRHLSLVFTTAWGWRENGHFIPILEMRKIKAKKAIH